VSQASCCHALTSGGFGSSGHRHSDREASTVVDREGSEAQLHDPRNDGAGRSGSPAPEVSPICGEDASTAVAGARSVVPPLVSSHSVNERRQVVVGGLGIVSLVALALGVVASRFVGLGSPFVVAVSVTASVGLAGGLAAGSYLQRFADWRQRVGQGGEPSRERR
jgi:hypothetical protein